MTINKVFETTRLIHQKKNLDIILKFLEEETEDCASVYDFSIKNQVPSSMYQHYAQKEEDEIWDILKTWDHYRHKIEPDYYKLISLLGQQYLMIIMINSFIERKKIEKNIKDKFDCFEFVMR
jgi:hypothetical protein